jgi:hypothetical protein
MNVKYFYLRNDYNNRDVTIVTSVVPENNKYRVDFAWAFRSNHDQFVKKLGRGVVDVRLQLNDPNYSDTIWVDEKKSRKIKFEILKRLLTKESTPQKYIEDISWSAYELAAQKPEVDPWKKECKAEILSL